MGQCQNDYPYNSCVIRSAYTLAMLPFPTGNVSDSNFKWFLPYTLCTFVYIMAKDMEVTFGILATN